MTDTFDQLCDEAREAKGDLLNAIRCAVNELIQAEQIAWVRTSSSGSC